MILNTLKHYPNLCKIDEDEMIICDIPTPNV